MKKLARCTMGLLALNTVCGSLVFAADAPTMLHAMPSTRIFLTALNTVATNEDDKYSSMRAQTSYGQVSGVGVQATRGAKVKVAVEMTIHAVTKSQLLDSYHKLATTYNKSEQYHEDQTQYGGGGGFGFLGSFFGLFGGGGYSHSEENSSYNVNANGSQEAKDLVNQVCALTTSKVNIKGELEVEGFSMMPSTAYVFMETLTVQRTDKSGQTTSVTIVDDSGSATAVAADSSGKVNGQVSGKINVQPFS